MGVFKWLRRERVTVTTENTQSSEAPALESHKITHTEILRTEEYKRDLAEFQARRSAAKKELQETPEKKKCGRHSLPVSCTSCAADPDNSFNYEKKSATEHKKHKRRSATAIENRCEGVPNVQFLFQNQVFMPGNILQRTSYSEPQKSKRHLRRKHYRLPEMDFIVRKQIDFKEDEDRLDLTPLFYKNNSLPYDVKHFLEGHRSDEEEVDGSKASDDDKISSHDSSKINKDDSCEDKLWEVMSELKNFDKWADEQLQVQSPNVSKSDDSKSDTSTYGLPIASACNLDIINMDKAKMWNQGQWGVVPIQIKRLTGVTIEQVKKKRNVEINILRKCRHPNIILLMGLYPDIQNNVHIICEKCVDTLFDILHLQDRKPSVQTSVQYALDIVSALAFLGMHGYIHTELSSLCVMVTKHDTVKLADLSACAKLIKAPRKVEKEYEIYSEEPQYINIEDTPPLNLESQPLLSQNPSEVYISSHAVCRPYERYYNTEHYRWQAPELFEPDEAGNVFPCSKSDVYSVCVILWECCNATIPWKTHSYEKLKKNYLSWKTGIRLPQNGTYPGCLLALLQNGLKLQRSERINLETLQNTLQTIKHNLDDMEYMVLSERLTLQKSNFSSIAWDSTSPTSDSDGQSFVKAKVEHKVVIHDNRDTSTDSNDKDCSKSESPQYEIILQNDFDNTNSTLEKCYVSDEEQRPPLAILKYDIPENDFSSACSTPVAKLRTRIRDIGTPGALHRSDSTEYCSILSPDMRNCFLNDSTKDHSVERPTAKLSISFTPKSYKPLHIKVPEFNLESLKSLPKDQTSGGRSSYNFDIKNYSLPTTPIARSNKLRKNAWLSGDLNVTDPCLENLKDSLAKPAADNEKEIVAISTREASFTMKSLVKNECRVEQCDQAECDQKAIYCEQQTVDIELQNNEPLTSSSESPECKDTTKCCFTQLKRVDPSQDYLSLKTDKVSPEINTTVDRTNTKHNVEEDILAKVNIKPLVAIHERWILEANGKNGRSMSLPEDNIRSQITAVKPASHCLDTLQKSLPQMNTKKLTAPKLLRMVPPSPKHKNGLQYDQFNQKRETIAKNLNFAAHDPDRFKTWSKNKGMSAQENQIQTKIDQSTDTQSIEEFIHSLIRKEFQHYVSGTPDDVSTSTDRKEEFNKGVANIIENLNNADDYTAKKEAVKSFSRVKINGNNKPLLQITFNRSGENSLQVLDNCVNVTICDANMGGNEKSNQSTEDTLVPEDLHSNVLKRCQAFNAIQEARSTEDLYIDDDLSTQMQENFGGRVKLIPLHGSLHEILCEKEDDCCLIKVKQENGCDTIYFRCENSDTESRDATDGRDHPQDTVVFKRSISLVEERIQRVLPKDKRVQDPRGVRKEDVKIRPKSEVYLKNITKESRVLSNSSPSLVMDKDEVELNIENVMSYQDSSSDECLKYQDNDDFEFLEREIEEDIANSNNKTSMGCLEKISEENLSVINEEISDKEHLSESYGQSLSNSRETV